ncbi:DMT family transporter [uncultured Psychroserpens sp.]|uniref:DMT family transporter n=1 Tax=uncultured Psychroserpens sp. TaxID=255436 RepID=UPI00262FE5E0|nr:DMT family transporter [uncultured Psychroserpens sp.]
MKDSHFKHVLWLTAATVFISTSGALGKFIEMPIPVIIWWRSALAAGLLFIFCKYKKISLKVHTRQDRITFIISALLLGAHWITYFYALKLSNVAIGMLSLFTFPVITAVLEPLFSKVKFDPIHIILGGLVLVGIYFLAPEFDLESAQLKGVLFGILSAICFAIRTLMLKQHTPKYNGTMLMFYQVLILSAVLVPFLFTLGTSAIETQFPYVILLALLTTAIGHTMFINSLKYFKVSTASIIASTQPVFGIIIAFFFLNEIPSWNTYLGGALIISTVLIESMRSKRKKS